jgi:hypothetical protein
VKEVTKANMELAGSRRKLLEILLDYMIFDYSSWLILNGGIFKRRKSKEQLESDSIA